MCGPQRPKFGGFWILGILDFGDFGFWSLGILDFGFCDKFWILHKKKKTVHAEPGRQIFACFPLSCKPFLPSVSSLDIDHESWLDCVSYLRGELLSQKDRLLHLWRKVSNPKDLVGQWIVLHVCTTCFCMFVRFLIHTSPPDFSEFHSGRQTLTDGTTFMPSVQEPKYSSQTQLWCLVSSGHFWLQRWGCSAASACIL